MTRAVVKGEPSIIGIGMGGGADIVDVVMEDANVDSTSHGGVQRRLLRSSYLFLQNRILDARDDLSRPESSTFGDFFDEVETLYHHVKKPREQVADAVALLDIASTLATSVKAHGSGGVTPFDLVRCLLGEFGQQGGVTKKRDEVRRSLCWKDIGLAVSHVFMKGPGCCTMYGPMNADIKQRKAIVQRKRARPSEKVLPEELNQTAAEVKADTDKNMATMFDILKKYRSVRLERLVLDRNSFAKTVENLFALSFLVRDGRAEVKVDDNGSHLVSPRNAPAANALASKEVVYSHFLFRFGFRDWKLMLASVGVGEELMPRNNEFKSTSFQHNAGLNETLKASAAPIKKLCRNRGLILQEQIVMDNNSSEK